MRVDPAQVRLVPWSEDDLPLLIRLNAPEMGWSVAPEFQGRGIASAMVARAIELARESSRRPAIHAFPSVDNPPSNAICRKTGFTLLGEVRFEYPKGHWMQCNDWLVLVG